MSSFKIKKRDALFSAPLCVFEIYNNASLNKNSFLNHAPDVKSKKAQTYPIVGTAGIRPTG